MYTNPNPNLTPQCRARKHGHTYGWTNKGQQAMTLARWPTSSGAKNGDKFSKMIKNTVEGEKCWLQTISPFPSVFSNDLHCRQVKTRVCLGRG